MLWLTSYRKNTKRETTGLTFRFEILLKEDLTLLAQVEGRAKFNFNEGY